MAPQALDRAVPAFSIDAALGLVGFGLSIGWGKTTGRDMDREAVVFLAKIWGGIAVFGMILAFVV